MRPATRPSHFRSLFEVVDAVTVREIASTDLWLAPAAWPASEAFTAMSGRDFDVAPVDGHPPHRYVERSWLEAEAGTVAVRAQPLDASLVVTSALNLAVGMRELQERPFFFVIEGRELIGLVTRADVQRPAVSMIVLQFILIIEAGFTRLIEAYLGSTWRGLLPRKRAEGAEARLIERMRRNANLALEDCLTLEDRVAIVKESSELLRALGFASKSAYQAWTGRLRGSVTLWRTQVPFSTSIRIRSAP